MTRKRQFQYRGERLTVRWFNPETGKGCVTGNHGYRAMFECTQSHYDDVDCFKTSIRIGYDLDHDKSRGA